MFLHKVFGGGGGGGFFLSEDWEGGGGKRDEEWMKGKIIQIEKGSFCTCFPRHIGQISV